VTTDIDELLEYLRREASKAMGELAATPECCSHDIQRWTLEAETLGSWIAAVEELRASLTAATAKLSEPDIGVGF